MSDVVLGRPPDPIGWVQAPPDLKTGAPGAVTITWLDTTLEQAWVGLFAANKCWLANLTQATTALVASIVTGDHQVIVVAKPPAGAAWERDDAYCLQRQEDIWHFSKRETAESMLDSDDWLFGWTLANTWGVAKGPEDKSQAYIEEKLARIGINRQTPGVNLDDPAQKLDYEVQVLAATGAVVAVRRLGDAISPWGLTDKLPPFAVSRRSLLHADAAAEIGKSLSVSGDGFGLRTSAREAVLG